MDGGEGAILPYLCNIDLVGGKNRSQCTWHSGGVATKQTKSYCGLGAFSLPGLASSRN